MSNRSNMVNSMRFSEVNSEWKIYFHQQESDID